MGGKQFTKETAEQRGGRLGKNLAPLEEKLNTVKWGEFKLRYLFNHIEQGRRLKKGDQKPGNIPFVMSGITNQGVIGHISNPVASFPANSITVDIFGNAFYRSFAFGAGDDTGVYWNDRVSYSTSTMIFFAAAIGRLLKGKYSYGHKLRSSQSLDFLISLPQTDSGDIDFDFMESFVHELEGYRLLELEEYRLRKLEAYLIATGLDDYNLTIEDQETLESFSALSWREYDVTEVFNVKNTHNILSNEIQPGSGTVPYLCASAENNGVSSYISHDENLKERGNCIFIGGKTFVVSYQSDDFFSNDSHNLALYFKTTSPNRLQHLFMVTCVINGLGHKYTWGDSISKTKIKKDTLMLPADVNGDPDLDTMERIIAVVQKLAIADVARNTARHLEATRSVVEQSEETKTIKLHPSANYTELIFEPMMAAEAFECYKWNRFDKAIIDFFGGDKTILIGCTKNKRQLKWVLEHKIYNVRLGKAKGSAEKHKDMFDRTSLLVLYELDQPGRLTVFKINGHQQMNRNDLKAMGYPSWYIRKSYETFNITPLEMDLSPLINQRLIEKLIEMNPENEKGTPAFIEP